MAGEELRRQGIEECPQWKRPWGQRERQVLLEVLALLVLVLARVLALVLLSEVCGPIGCRDRFGCFAVSRWQRAANARRRLGRRTFHCLAGVLASVARRRRAAVCSHWSGTSR